MNRFRIESPMEIHHTESTHQRPNFTAWNKSLAETLDGLVDASAPAFRVVLVAVFDEVTYNRSAQDFSAVQSMIGGPRDLFAKLKYRESYAAAI
ncbi:hypothetical protein H9P43_005266 [Blastocladiella emersonii ATCC 22665]|nr:hypothetical protein H9P43_005266 [Blastocladiella emersonii ATCC 22665]